MMKEILAIEAKNVQVIVYQLVCLKKELELQKNKQV